LALPQAVFRLLSILHVRSGGIPPDNAALHILVRVVEEEKPAIFAVPPAYSSLDLERNTSRNPAIPAFKEGCKLIGMKALTALIVVQKILGCPIEEVQHDTVGIKPVAISIKDDDELGHSIHELLQIPLRLLAILYIRPCQVPANDHSV